MSTQFAPRSAVTRPPLMRPAPRDEEPGWLRFGDVLGIGVYLGEAMSRQLLGWARKSYPRETLGLLLGRPCEDWNGPFTLVTDAVQATCAQASRSHVLADAEQISELLMQARLASPIAEVVGWWHTHPGYGTQFSAVDEATQATFVAVSSVGVVIDPTRAPSRALGVYLGPYSGPLFLIDLAETPHAA